MLIQAPRINSSPVRLKPNWARDFLFTRRTKILMNSSPPAKKTRVSGLFLAGGEGFEPPLTESESVVLPLDDPPVTRGR